MHNHNDNNGDGNKGMMWMMLMCAVPLLVLLFVWGKGSSAGYLVPVLILGCFVAHLFMMRRGHGASQKDAENHDGDERKLVQDETAEADAKAKDKKDHSCCH